MYIDKLLSISSPSISPATNIVAGDHGPLVHELYRMLEKRNGFYTFESALHVFPYTAQAGQFGLAEWNAPGLWIKEYGGMADGMLFFAEDIIATQFCIKDNKIYSFEPETAALEFIANDLQGWAKALLDNYRYLTGHPLAHEWQVRHGALPPGKRLAPKIPQIGGGKLNIESVYLADPVQLMNFRGMIAQKVKDLPDGARIRFKVT
jgi:hypothetical protein